jgi:hypothetical protein
METTSVNPSPNHTTLSAPSIDWKIIVIVLLIIIILLFTSLGSFSSEFISNLLYSTGWIIGKTSDVVSATSETGIDIANGAIHNGSDLLIKASNKQGNIAPSNIGPIIKHEPSTPPQQNPPPSSGEPRPDTTTNPIQKPITSGKANWCLVGEYQGRRGCIEIAESDKCMSGQIFPSQYACLNPTFTQNVVPNMATPMGIPPRTDLSALPNIHPTYDEQQYAAYQITNVPKNTNLNA